MEILKKVLSYLHDHDIIRLTRSLVGIPSKTDNENAIALFGSRTGRTGDSPPNYCTRLRVRHVEP
jgi:hypothetical protein